ncbi:MAG: hypothetical protein ABI569_02705 [Casimicrobiaceae bacterium]
MVRNRTPWQLSALCGLAVAAVAGCAPDSVSNKYATGFNAYLDQIAVACKPLMIGSYDMTYRLQQKGVYSDDFNYFFDLTSKLYYRRTSPADYRSGINGFFGGGSTTDRSIDCIISNLPGDRPAAGPPLGGALQIN